MKRSELRKMLFMSDDDFEKFVKRQNSLPAGEILIERYECGNCGKQFDKTNISMNATVIKCMHCGDLKSNNKKFVTYVNFLIEEKENQYLI